MQDGEGEKRNALRKIFYQMKTSDWEIQKKYFRVSEVAKILNVTQSKIRFWNAKFNIGAQLGDHGRLYSREMVAKLHVVYNLLKEQKYTIEGAKQKLNEL